MNGGIRMGDLTIHESLAVVVLDGFEGESEYEGQLDTPGSPNWLCERYGMADEDYTAPGILETDYDFGSDPWKFSVLVRDSEADDVVRCAEEAGFRHVQTCPVEAPEVYGDGAGTVEILKHRDGWVIIPS